MKTIHERSRYEIKNMDTKELRASFLLQNLMQNDQLNVVYSAVERFVIGGVQPVSKVIELGNYDSLKSEYFLERRELGIINVGGTGSVIADGETFSLDKLSCLYLGRGTKSVSFASADSNQPALFFLLSTTAHAAFPNTLFSKEMAEPVDLGTAENANQRTIYKYIHQNGIQSCQLVMGLTVLKSGSIWNTMPAHTHDRRSEVYFYFDLQADAVVFHLMGEPTETRHLVVRNNESIISPPWSIHSGAGTSNYSFIWGMGGENQDFTDMDMVKMIEIL